jgi:hypothetical protein
LTDPGDGQFGTAETLSGTNFALSAGETVDFVVGDNPSLGAGEFTTQVDATLTEEAPEPSTYAMTMLGGAVVLALLARRKSVLLLD